MSLNPLRKHPRILVALLLVVAVCAGAAWQRGGAIGQEPVKEAKSRGVAPRPFAVAGLQRCRRDRAAQRGHGVQQNQEHAGCPQSHARSRRHPTAKTR